MKYLILFLLLSGCTSYKDRCSNLKPPENKPDKSYVMFVGKCPEHATTRTNMNNKFTTHKLTRSEGICTIDISYYDTRLDYKNTLEKYVECLESGL